MLKNAITISSKYGMLTVLKEIEPIRDNQNHLRRQVECQCDCGKIIKRLLRNVISKHHELKSCGCHKKLNVTNHIGSKYNMLTILKEVEPRIQPDGQSKRMVECQCDCGNITALTLFDVTKDIAYSCGCVRRPRARLDTTQYIGQHFGKLTVIGTASDLVTDSGSYYQVKCQCDCGTTKYIMLQSLLRDQTKSCGCLRIANRIKHGMWQSREYATWENMIQRCTNINTQHYASYGGRGITICDDWLNSFEKFYGDIGPRPDKTTLNRIDNDLGYYKENCRWATGSEQINNTRLTQLIEYEGVTKTTLEWAKEFNISRKLLSHRFKMGMSPKEALFFCDLR